MDPQHSGPCAVYLKKVESAIASNNAAGDGWFKIWEEGYDEAAGKWCTNKMIDNKGHLAVKIPADIQQGYYLLRPELLALHAAQDSPPDPQFYSNCVQLYVESSGTAQPATVAIPGHIPNNAPGLTFNIYASPLALPFPLFGPAPYGSNGVATPAASGNSSSPAPASPASPAGSNAPAPASPGYGDADNADDEEPQQSEATGNDAKDDADQPEQEDGAEDDAEDDDEEDDSDECDADDDDEDESDANDADDAADPADAEDSSDADEGADAGNTPYADEAAPATGASGSTPSASAANTTPSSNAAPVTSTPNGQTEGLKPANCVLVNANWCGIEVPSYSSADACWTSSKNCWEQSKACFDQAPPTGAFNCEIWNDKCNALDDACNGGSSSGPANAGKDLTPALPSLTDSKVRRLMAAVKRHETHVMRRAYRAVPE